MYCQELISAKGMCLWTPGIVVVIDLPACVRVLSSVLRLISSGYESADI